MGSPSEPRVGHHPGHVPTLAGLHVCPTNCCVRVARDKLHYRLFRHGYAPTRRSGWISSVHH
eukprot:9904191-Lingulodinium_polyedra.AAC.1